MGKKKLLENILELVEDMSELVDADIDRVDLVGKAANGHRFLLAKSDSTNLIPADIVRDFIEKANEDTMPNNTEEITKEDLDANEILATPAETMGGDPEEPGSPAWEAIDAATAGKWTAILARAKNAMCELKDREKAEVEAGFAWEEDGIEDLKDAIDAIDYAISLLAPFAVSEMAEAEMAQAEMDGIMKAMKVIKQKDLSTIEGVTPLIKAGRSLSSSNEAALRGAVESIMKVLDSLPAAPVSPVEGETNLGAETEKPAPAAIAKDRLDQIVQDAIEKADEMPEEDVTEDVVVEEEAMDEEAPVEKAGEMDGMSDDELARVALTGSDSERGAALQEIGLRTLSAGVNVKPVETPAEEAAEEEVVETPTEEIAEEAMTAEAPAEEEPAPADQVGTASEMMKTSSSESAEKMAKEVEKVVKSALDEQSAEYSTVIKALEDRIAHLEAPAPSKVLANGALPPAHLLRGQDHGASMISDASALRKQLDDAPDAVTKSDVSEQMRIAAIEALSSLRNQ